MQHKRFCIQCFAIFVHHSWIILIVSHFATAGRLWCNPRHVPILLEATSSNSKRCMNSIVMQTHQVCIASNVFYESLNVASPAWQIRGWSASWQGGGESGQDGLLLESHMHQSLKSHAFVRYHRLLLVLLWVNILTLLFFLEICARLRTQPQPNHRNFPQPRPLQQQRPWTSRKRMTRMQPHWRRHWLWARAWMLKRLVSCLGL